MDENAKKDDARLDSKQVQIYLGESLKEGTDIGQWLDVEISDGVATISFDGIEPILGTSSNDDGSGEAKAHIFCGVSLYGLARLRDFLNYAIPLYPEG